MRHLLAVSIIATGCTPSLEAPARREAGQRSADTVRVVSWNIESVGSPSSSQYAATLEILARLDADVVAIQEVQWFEDNLDLQDLAVDAGYPHVVTGWPVSFGTDTQAILSRLPILDSALLDSDDLSSDPNANDLTRSIVVATVDAGGTPVTVASAHLKSGAFDDDEFRRAVDSIRGLAALGSFNTATDAVLFCGDMNEEVEDLPLSPSVFTSMPSGLPSSYFLGAELFDQLGNGGIPNDPFAEFQQAGMVVLDAEQIDGSETTRPVSGRRLDYCFTSQRVADNVATEVYDTADDQDGLGLDKAGSVPTASTLSAADHLPLIVDFTYGGGDIDPDPDDVAPGELRIAEVMADPSECDDTVGEWLEIHNTTTRTLDLTGLSLADNSSSHTLGDLELAAGARAVLARTVDACGVGTVDATMPLQLSNGGDNLTLSNPNSTVIDSVQWSGAPRGLSLSFDDGSGCETIPTPGTANADCDGVVDPQVRTLGELGAGDLLLSEIMANPDSCSDDVGEWIEVHNPGDTAIDLTGLEVQDNQAGGSVISGTAVVAPGGFAVLGRSEQACVAVDATFDRALGNSGDTVTLVGADELILDQFAYSSGEAGEPWARDGDDWCLADPTPGAQNPGC